MIPAEHKQNEKQLLHPTRKSMKNESYTDYSTAITQIEPADYDTARNNDGNSKLFNNGRFYSLLNPISNIISRF